MSFIESLCRTLFPKLCIFCKDKVVGEEEFMCDACAELFAKEQAKLCPECFCAVNVCTCEKPKHITKARSVFWYEGMLRSTVFELKTLEYDENFGFAIKRMASAVKDDELLMSCDYICYVPRTEENTRVYGHDTAKLLAEGISEKTGIPVRSLLSCIKKTDQKTLSKQERLKNIRGAFSIKDGAESAYGKALLVDDVTTTGATAEECAKVLLKAGASDVCALFFARARLKEQA